MLNNLRSVAFVAVHQGPRATLTPVAAALGRRAVWAPERPRWRSWLRGVRPFAVVRGTSEIAAARNPEALLARQAAASGIPVYVIEDFPGNFRDHRFHPISRLFVEFDSARRHHRALGLSREIRVVGNPRYEAAMPPATARAEARRRLRVPSTRRIVLWAGQPDEGLSRKSLEAVADQVRRHNAVLLYRGHPRSGRHRRPKGVDVIDVSADRAVGDAVRAADLVATQFSTLAVEAGRMGVPALFVLLPDGRRYLRSRTGNDELPWPGLGAAFLARTPAELSRVFPAALDDRRKRQAALARFGELQRRNRGAAKKIAQEILAAPGKNDQA